MNRGLNMRVCVPTVPIAVSVGILAFAAPHASIAQEPVLSAEGASLTLGGRLHGRFQASSVEEADNSFFIRRARIRLDAEFGEFLDARLQTDFAGGRATLLDAWIRFDITDGVSVYGGQFKRSIDVFELSSSSNLSIIERDGRVGGYDECTGVGLVCSYGRLMEALLFSGRDQGLKVTGTSGSFAIEASLTNGRLVGMVDDNDAKSFSGRASLTLMEDVVVSGNVGVHDYLDPFDESANAIAWGGDVQVGTWRDGFLMQGAVVTGDNWRSLDGSGDPGAFTTFQVVASYYHPTDLGNFGAIEPLARLSFADPDGDIDEDGGTLITPGLMLYVSGRNKIGVNLDYYMPQTGDSVYSVKFQSYLYF
jgi:hypothetical protein